MWKCDVCKTAVNDETSWRAHIEGKKHKKNNEQFEKKKGVFKKSVFVTNLPNYASEADLYEFFTQFGVILKFYFQPRRHLLIEFETEDSAKYLLSNSINFFQTKLCIKQRIVRNDNAKSPNQRISRSTIETINGIEEIVYSNIKSIFEVESSFDEQLTMFLNKVAVDDSEIQNRYQFTCRKLEEIFQRQINFTCKVYRFGSTVTGLGLKNCDLDIYLDSGTNAMNPAAIFMEVKRLLYSKSSQFKNIVPIPKAKTPIIKFIFISTNVSCDISFKNSLAVHNSRLLRFYLDLDPRWRPIMMILKYWMSKYQLSMNSNKLSKYSLTLLFIFYLQQQKLVPPIMEIKKRCKPEFVEGWQINFDETQKKYDAIDTESKNKGIPEILQGFFSFYSSYDFKTNVICPIDGLSHKKNIFKDINQLPESMNFYKEYLETTENPVYFPETKTMCVQDPNELNHNITAGVSEQYLEVFQKYCTTIAEIINTEAEKNYKTLLPSLFSLNIEFNQSYKLVGVFKIFSKNFLRVNLPKNFKHSEKESDKKIFIQDNWFNLIIKLIHDYLEKVLKFEIQQTDSELREKQKKTETNSDVHSENSAVLVMNCQSNFCLWKNRNKYVTNILDPSISLLQKEILVTENMLADVNNEISKENMNFKCEIVKKRKPVVHLIINLRCTDGLKYTFVDFANFLVETIPKTVYKTLEHMQQFEKNSVD